MSSFEISSIHFNYIDGSAWAEFGLFTLHAQATFSPVSCRAPRRLQILGVGVPNWKRWTCTFRLNQTWKESFSSEMRSNHPQRPNVREFQPPKAAKSRRIDPDLFLEVNCLMFANSCRILFHDTLQIFCNIIFFVSQNFCGHQLRILKIVSSPLFLI